MASLFMTKSLYICQHFGAYGSVWTRGGGALPAMAYKGYLFHGSCIWKVGISRVKVNENERVGKSELWPYCFNLLNAAWKWQENLLFGGWTKGVPFLSKMVYKGKGVGPQGGA